MSDLYKDKSDLHIARCQESKAHNDLAYCKKQAMDQESQLEELLKHKKECVDGMKMAKQTGLTPLHIRELQLLVKHITSVVETLSYKVDASQKNIEAAEKVWHEKNEYFEKVKESKKKGKKTSVGNMSVEGDDDSTQDWKTKVKDENYYKGGHPPTMAKKNNRSR